MLVRAQLQSDPDQQKPSGRNEHETAGMLFPSDIKMHPEGRTEGFIFRD